MTDRVHSLLVVLEKDTRVDDVEGLKEAILRFHGVISVHGNVANYTDQVAQDRVRHELGEKLWQVLYPDRKAG